MSPRGRSTGPTLMVVAVVWVALCGGCGGGGVDGGLNAASVPVESENLEVAVRDLVVQPEEGRQEWSFTLVCDQSEGCRGTVRLEICYRSQGRERTVDAMREVDLPYRGEVRIGRSGPLERVDRVERVRVGLVGRPHTGAIPAGGRPRPSPRS